MKNFSSYDLLMVTILALASGLDSGSYFSDRYEPWHFQADPGGNREQLVLQAAMTIAMYNSFGVSGLTSQELYMLYGVFTERAAWLVIYQAEELDLSK